MGMSRGFGALMAILTLVPTVFVGLEAVEYSDAYTAEVGGILALGFGTLLAAFVLWFLYFGPCTLPGLPPVAFLVAGIALGTIGLQAAASAYGKSGPDVPDSGGLLMPALVVVAVSYVGLPFPVLFRPALS